MQLEKLKGTSYEEISKIIKIDINKIRKKSSELKLNQNFYKISPEIQVKIKELTDNCLCDKEIATKLNIKTNTIRSYKRKYKIKSIIKNSKWSEDENKIFIDMLKNNKTLIEIGIILKRNPAAMAYHAIRNLKLRTIYPELNKYINKDKRRHATIESFLLKKFSDAKRGAIIRNLKFEINFEFIKNLYYKQNGKCFWTGYTMTKDKEDYHKVSIDRISSDNSIGYTEQKYF